MNKLLRHSSAKFAPCISTLFNFNNVIFVKVFPLKSKIYTERKVFGIVPDKILWERSSIFIYCYNIRYNNNYFHSFIYTKKKYLIILIPENDYKIIITYYLLYFYNYIYNLFSVYKIGRIIYKCLIYK